MQSKEFPCFNLAQFTIQYDYVTLYTKPGMLGKCCSNFDPYVQTFCTILDSLEQIDHLALELQQLFVNSWKTAIFVWAAA